MSRKVRSAAVLFLFLILAAGAVQARTWSPSWEPAGFLEDLWLRFAARVTAFREKEGGMMDPNGGKEGSMMDPDGKPSDAVTHREGEAGGMMDPDG